MSGRRAVIAGTLAAALLGIGADQAAASYTGRVQDDTLTLTGNSASDKLLLQIVSPTELMTVGSARPMEDAAKIAYTQLVLWLEDEHGFDRWDAYQLVTQAGKLYVGNMVDTYYSLVAKIDRSFL